MAQLKNGTSIGGNLALHTGNISSLFQAIQDYSGDVTFKQKVTVNGALDAKGVLTSSNKILASSAGRTIAGSNIGNGAIVIDGKLGIDDNEIQASDDLHIGSNANNLTLRIGTGTQLRVQATKVLFDVPIHEQGTALSAKYLGKTAKAADSDKLDGLNSTQFLRKDVSQTLDAGTNTSFTVKSNDGGISSINAYGDTQGTGVFYAGQSTSHGGGFGYNGDGTPTWVGGTDRVVFYRKTSNVDHTVFSYAHDSNTVNFESTPTIASSNHLVYHEGHKPTVAEIGALASGAKAVDSDKLDGLNSTDFVKNSDQWKEFSRTYSVSSTVNLPVLDFDGATIGSKSDRTFLLQSYTNSTGTQTGETVIVKVNESKVISITKIYDAGAANNAIFYVEGGLLRVKSAHANIYHYATRTTEIRNNANTFDYLNTYRKDQSDARYLGITAKAANSSLLNGFTHSETTSINTIVKRNGSGDVIGRLFRSTYQDENKIEGAIAYRINDGSNNYIRYCNNKGAIRTFLDVYAKSDVYTKTQVVDNTLFRINNTTDYKTTANKMSQQEYGASLPHGLSAYNYGQTLTFNDANARTRIYFPHREGDISAMYISTGWGSDVKNWERVLTQSYSDGRYARLSENNTFSSSINYFNKIRVVGTGNDYNSGGIEVNGNGTTNTVFPTIGFHQSGKYASSIQLRGAADFRFYAQGASSYANIRIGHSYMSGSSIYESRNNSAMGVYDSNKTDQIWSMGSSYRNHVSGTNFGSLYGLGYKHTNNTTGGSMAGGHQMVWCANGEPKSAMGDSFWTKGSFIQTSGNVALKFSDTNKWVFSTGSSYDWGLFWDTNVNQFSFRGAGIQRWWVDCDNGETSQAGSAHFSGGGNTRDVYIGNGAGSWWFANKMGIVNLDTNSSGSTTHALLRQKVNGVQKSVLEALNTGSSWRLRVESGNIDFNSGGHLTASGNVTAYSDIRTKRDIKVIDNALTKIGKLKGVTFNRTDLALERQTGLIAQDLQKVLPEAVTESTTDDLETFPDGKKLSVSYGNVVGLLVEGIKEEKQKRVKVEQELKELQLSFKMFQEFVISKLEKGE